MLFGYIHSCWVQPTVTSFFLGWQSNNTLILNSLGSGGSILVFLLPFPMLVGTLGALQGRDRRNPGFTSLFLVAPLTLFTPTSCFPFLFIDPSRSCCPPRLLTLVFIPPCLQPLSTFGDLHRQGDDWDKAHEGIFQLRSTDLRQRWITAFQQKTSGKMERNRNWFSPYLGGALPDARSLVLPETFHQWLIRVREFVTKYLVMTISCSSISFAHD